MNTETNTGKAPLDPQGKALEILEARARLLARPQETARDSGAQLEVVEFRLAHERYAIELRHVLEVAPFDSLTPLPCVPPHILGIMNLRAQVLPVLAIKKFFELPEVGITDLHMVLVVQVDDVELGILADSVTGVRAIEQQSLEPALPTLTGIRAQYLKGIAPGGIVVLDAARILRDPGLLINEEVGMSIPKES
jgi:purine-binding chemotaxis protein CheW